MDTGSSRGGGKCRCLSRLIKMEKDERMPVQMVLERKLPQPFCTGVLVLHIKLKYLPQFAAVIFCIECG